MQMNIHIRKVVFNIILNATYYHTNIVKFQVWLVVDLHID